MPFFEHADWADCGIGSSVTFEDKTISRRRLELPEMTPEQLEMLLSQVPDDQREMFRKGEMSFQMQSRYEAVLVERHADWIVVEISTKTTGPGVNRGFTRREVIPSVPPPPEPAVQEISHWEEDGTSGSATVVKLSNNAIFQGVPAAEGEETLDVADRPMACRWKERATDTPMGRLQEKTWRCADIPGGIARTSFRMDGPMEHQTGESQVIAFERKAP